MLDVSLDDSAWDKFKCTECPASLRKVRNCGGEYKPVSLYVNGTRYTQCPVSIYMMHLDMKMTISMYMQGRSTKTKFTDAPILEQTNWYFEFCGFIESKINESERRQMDNANDKAKTETNQIKRAEMKKAQPAKPKTAAKRKK